MRCFSLLRTVMCTLPSQQLAVFALAHNTYIACLLTAPKVDIEWCFVEGRPSAIHRLAAVLSARYGSSTANSRRGSGTRRGPISNAAQFDSVAKAKLLKCHFTAPQAPPIGVIHSRVGPCDIMLLRLLGRAPQRTWEPKSLDQQAQCRSASADSSISSIPKRGFATRQVYRVGVLGDSAER